MISRLLRTVTVAALSAALGACAVSNAPPPPSTSGGPARMHLAEFDSDDVPIDDPGSPGEARAMQYTKAYFESLGLKTMVQSVPLVQLIPTAASLQFHGPGGHTVEADGQGTNYLIWPGQQKPRVSLDSELVFAGYGIVSPEYSRNDYKDVNVAGKIVLVLEGAPHTGERDELGVLGETHYGTRFYKFAEAARHGAAGILIIHTDVSTPWEVIRTLASGSNIELDAATQGVSRLPRTEVEGWLSQLAAETLFTIVGLDYQALLEDAHQLAFVPKPIQGLRVTLDMTSTVTRSESHDVIAYLPGQTSEYLMLAGRWNRIDPDAWTHPLHAPGNAPAALSSPRSAALSAAVATPRSSGLPTPRSAPPTAPPAGPALDLSAALADAQARRAADLADDDGTGAAMIMEAAQRLVALRARPVRGIAFMVTSAFKSGVIGLEYYLAHPPPAYPVDKMTALIFLDRADLGGTSQRIGKIGADSDEALSQITREASIEQGRLLEIDQDMETRFYYTLSQSTLESKGVRVIYLTTRPEQDVSNRLRHVALEDQGRGSAPAMRADPSRDAVLLDNIMTRVANATNWPPRIDPAVGEATTSH